MRNTPIRERGGTFNGHTDWHIDWQYQTRQESHICHIHNVQVKVHVIHTLPALSEYVTDERTITVFNKFNNALTQHEKNHGNNGLLAAREIDKAISEMTSVIPSYKNTFLPTENMTVSLRVVYPKAQSFIK